MGHFCLTDGPVAREFDGLDKVVVVIVGIVGVEAHVYGIRLHEHFDQPSDRSHGIQGVAGSRRLRDGCLRRGRVWLGGVLCRLSTPCNQRNENTKLAHGLSKIEFRCQHTSDLGPDDRQRVAISGFQASRQAAGTDLVEQCLDAQQR